MALFRRGPQPSPTPWPPAQPSSAPPPWSPTQPSSAPPPWSTSAGSPPAGTASTTSAGPTGPSAPSSWMAALPGLAADDSPQALRTTLLALVRGINSSAGRLPIGSVVAARRVTDLVAEVLRTAELRPLDVYAVLSIKGIVTDYLPTTIRAFLAVDESMIDTARPSGRTPAQSLAEQLDALETSAGAVLNAVHEQDADALMTQGNFLSTKFSGSDLDL